MSYEFHDYKKQGIDADTLKIWLKEIGQDTVLNKKGTTWKKLSEDEQTRALSSEDHLIEALIAQPSLIKRPVLQTSKGFLVGFDETAYQNLECIKKRAKWLVFLFTDLVGTNPRLVTAQC